MLGVLDRLDRGELPEYGSNRENRTEKERRALGHDVKVGQLVDEEWVYQDASIRDPKVKIGPAHVRSSWSDV